MRIYLAARYSRRLELCEYRKEIEAMGHKVTSRWLNGEHQISNKGVPIGDNGEKLVEDGSSHLSAELRDHFAQEDVADVVDANCIVSFTEAPRTTKTRGGRHVEFGIALGLLMAAKDLGTRLVTGPTKLIVIGHRENLFHWLPDVEFYETWDDAKQVLFADEAVASNR